jgi:hypothetical protein
LYKVLSSTLHSNTKNKTMSSVERSPVQNYLLRPLVTGAFGYGLCYAIIGNSGGVETPLGMLSPAMAIGTSVAVASAAGSAIQQQLQASQPDALADVSAMLIAPVLTGAVAVLTTRILVGPTQDYSAIMKIAGIGAAAEVGSVYVSDSVLALLPNF